MRTNRTLSGSAYYEEIMQTNQLVMQAKNTDMNMKLTAKFYNIIRTKLVSRARKVITSNL